MSLSDDRKRVAKLFNAAGKRLQELNPNEEITVGEIMHELGVGPEGKRALGWPTDYCYNATNQVTPFDHHIFVRVSPGRFRWLGCNARFSGPILWKNQRVGMWDDGEWAAEAYPLTQWK